MPRPWRLLPLAAILVVAAGTAPAAHSKPISVEALAAQKARIAKGLKDLAARAEKAMDAPAADVIRGVRVIVDPQETAPAPVPSIPAVRATEKAGSRDWLVDGIRALAPSLKAFEAEAEPDVFVLGRLVRQVPDVVEALERLNACRVVAGCPPVGFSGAASKGCILHARYLALSGYKALAAKGANFHDEDPRLPGYTDEGKAVAPLSVMSWNRPAGTVDVLMATYIHRLVLLDPAEKTVGVGSWEGGVDLASCLHGGGEIDRASAARIVAYPADGQAGLPRGFYETGELPPPVLGVDFASVGFPVTLTFYRGAPVSGVVASLSKDGKDVPCWVSSPGAYANPAAGWPMHVSQTIALMPKAPLASQSKYEVRVTCSLASSPWDKTWSFTTGR